MMNQTRIVSLPELKQPQASLSISASGRDCALASESGIFIVDLELPGRIDRLTQPQSQPLSSSWHRHHSSIESRPIDTHSSMIKPRIRCEWHPYQSHQNLLVSTFANSFMLHDVTRQAQGGSIISQTDGAHSLGLTDVQWSLFDPFILATASLDACIQLWDLRVPAAQLVTSASFASASSTAGMGATVSSLSSSMGHQSAASMLVGQRFLDTEACDQVLWNHKAEFVLASSHMNRVCLWDVRKGSTPFATIEEDGFRIQSIDWSQAREQELLVLSGSGRLRIWGVQDLGSGPVVEYETQSPMSAWKARFTPFGEGVIVSHKSETFHVSLFHREHLVADLKHDSSPAVTNFAWRVSGGNFDQHADYRKYQLMTWDSDMALRAISLKPQIFNDLGHRVGPEVVDTNVMSGSGSVRRSLLLSEMTASFVNDGNGIRSRNDQSGAVGLLKSELTRVARQLGHRYRVLLIDCKILDGQQVSVKFLGTHPRAKEKLLFTCIFSLPPGWPKIEIALSSDNTPLSLELFNLDSINKLSLPITTGRRGHQEYLKHVVKLWLGGSLQSTDRKLFKNIPTSISASLDLIESGATPALESVKDDDASQPIDRIPFPRLCSGRFSASGSLIVFWSGSLKHKNTMITPRTFEDYQNDQKLSVRGPAVGAWYVETRKDELPKPSFDSTSSLAESLRTTAALVSYSSYDEKKGNIMPASPTVDRRVISVFDVSNLIFRSRALAEGYTLQGDDPVFICRHNRACAEQYGRLDVVYAWRLMEQILLLRKDLKVDLYAPSGPHPCAEVLADILLKHFEGLGDVQTLAMLSCVLEHPFPPNMYNIMASPAVTITSRTSPLMPHFARTLFKMPRLSKTREELPQPDVTRASNSSDATESGANNIGQSFRNLMSGKSIPSSSSPPMLPNSFARLKQETGNLVDSMGDALIPSRRRGSPSLEKLAPGTRLTDKIKASSDALEQSTDTLTIFATEIIPRKRRPVPSSSPQFESSSTIRTLILSQDRPRHMAWRTAYSDLLYRWGLLNQHAQLGKFLFDENQGAQSGVEFGPKCERCDAVLHTRMCPSCLKYASKCAICHLPPKGVACFCYICGHGGHTKHMQEWFLIESECPQGCGCPCIASGGLVL